MKGKLTTRYSINAAFVMEPSTTVPATIPSSVRSASIDILLPLTKTCFFSAFFPFFDHPELLLVVQLSFNTSSMKPSFSG
jgi:hypothetical protein